jgi:phospholipid/cholesterol/gamma-HCH transport system permease protein
MDQPAEFTLEESEDGLIARPLGDWTAESLGDAGSRLERALSEGEAERIDLRKLARLDTAGAYAVIRAARAAGREIPIDARPAARRLLTLVRNNIETGPKPLLRPDTFRDYMIRLGKYVVELGWDIWETLVFGGHLLLVFVRAVIDPRRIRWAAWVSQIERAGLDALPIVAVTSFFIGAVVALLGANILRDFGAQIFSVDLIGIAVLREFNIVITAVLLAGRSASSFAAEIGSMKMNQEIDAMKVMGVDPYEALVLPRFAAMLITIPLLTFVATLAGIVGGLVVVWSVMDLGPAFFVRRFVDNVGAEHFWVGMSKAPVMAAVIAGIGCRQGLEVGGDVESLGRRVTAAVVQAIFAIIMIDAVFALVYMQLDI